MAPARRKRESSLAQGHVDYCHQSTPNASRFWGWVRHSSGAWLWLDGWEGGLIPGSLTAAAHCCTEAAARSPGCICAMSLRPTRHPLCVLHLSDGDFPSHLCNEDQLPVSIPIIQVTSTKVSSAQRKADHFIAVPRSQRHLMAHVPQYLYKLVLG